MLCWKCSKEISRETSRATLVGISVDVKMNLDPILPGDIDYLNEQLGKYSDGNGECHIALCYECYLDGLLRRGN